MADSPANPNVKSSTHADDPEERVTVEAQPESGFIDRDDRMSERQSSPTNPRVADKPDVNREEA